MDLRLTPRAASQLAELGQPAAKKLGRALRILQAVPHSGQPYPEGSRFHGSYYKVVAVRTRRWTYRVTYTIVNDVVWVRFIYPSWHPRTHPGSRSRDDH